MREFRNDTVAYLKHNLKTDGQNAQKYFRGKTIRDVIAELDVNIKEVAGPFVPQDSSMSYIILHVAKTDEYNSKHRKLIHDIWIFLETSLPQNSPICNKLKNGPSIFDEAIFNLIKDLKVKSIDYFVSAIVENRQ
jgi:hypothetical protein